MSLTTCAVSFYVYTDDGEPDEGATVSAILNQYEVYDGYVVPDLISGTTDSTGLATLNLWPNELGSTGSMYTIKILASNGKKLRTTAVVPNQTTANIEDIAALPAYDGKSDADASMTLAVTAASEALTSATSAAASAVSAAAQAASITSSVTSSAASATAAATSATSAATSATAAAASASSVSGYATTASTAATSASSSATAASTSASSAATSATTATTQASAAATSATSASSSATTATNAATSASTSATTATTKASEASTSATSASTSAATATTQASSASTSATNAAASATAAASSASVASAGGIRYDQSQSLTSGQKTQAQSNMGLSTVASTGSYSDLSNKPTIPVIGTTAQAWDADLDAIAALSGTTGLLKKTAANTWALDTSAYLTGITSAQVTAALGFTPYSAANPSNFLTGITSSQVTTALGFTPYNATNPSGYITSSSLTPYALLAGATFTGAVSATSFAGALNGSVGATTPSTGKFLYSYSPEITLTDATSIAWDASLGQVAKVTLGGSRTIAAPTNLVTGGFYSLILVQDSTGSRTASWNSVFAFTGGSAPTLSTTASSVDQIAFRYDGTKLREIGRSLGIA